MTVPKRLAMRAAVRIHARLNRPRLVRAEKVRLPEEIWNACLVAARKINKAEQHGWRIVSRRCRNELAQMLSLLRDQLAEIGPLLVPPVSVRGLPQQHIYQDILAVSDEFEEVELDMSLQTLSATTEPIELEGLYLGRFKIALDWGVISNRSPYEVVALDPQVANRDDGVVHPHVQGESLCEGDARLPIRRALEEGRLLDFFVIVRQTLQTYNPASAYVSIDEWSGSRCADCDGAMCDDEAYVCQRCADLVCDLCSASCTGCDSIVCSRCATRCPECDQPFCSNCLEPCSGCESFLCKECLTDERCSDCRRQGDRQRSVEEGQTDEPAEDDSAADAPLQRDRVGEADVPA